MTTPQVFSTGTQMGSPGFPTSIYSFLQGNGDVNGPAASTDNAVARFDGVTGKLLQNSLAIVDDAGNISATNLSGTNTGDVTLGAFGAAPSASGASLAGQVLTLQPADATRPGAVSILAQDIAGIKHVVDGLTFGNPAGPNNDSTLKYYDSGLPSYTQTWQGPWLANQTRANGWNVTRVSDVVTLEILSVGSLNDGAAPAPILSTIALPAYATPVGQNRTGILSTLDAGVYGAGAWQVDTTGIITITPTIDPAVAYPVGSTGVSGFGTGGTYLQLIYGVN